MKIRERDLINLGFERHDETVESFGSPNDWYYYTLNIRDFCLITNASDEINGDSWSVEIFQSSGFRFKDLKTLSQFINILKNNIVV